MPPLPLEHIAFNIADPRRAAAWYVRNLGMRIVRESASPPYIHFLADAGGAMLIELYNNPPDDVPAYGHMDPLQLHVAFSAADPDGARAQLEAAGATFVEERQAPDGSRLLMLRDPWGLCIQLCKRVTKLSPLP
jgi:catechol 2,3-dioxygenase-like lactoylglutathione lyase family enzyme